MEMSGSSTHERRKSVEVLELALDDAETAFDDGCDASDITKARKGGCGFGKVLLFLMMTFVASSSSSPSLGLLVVVVVRVEPSMRMSVVATKKKSDVVRMDWVTVDQLQDC